MMGSCKLVRVPQFMPAPYGDALCFRDQSDQC